MTGKRIWIFNLMLGALLVWGSLKLRESWAAFDETRGASLTRGGLAAAEVPRAAQASPVSLPAENWLEIASRNPFSVDRNDSDLVEPAPAPPPVATPKPILFGTLLLGSERLALLGKAGSRSRQSVKVGEDFDGWRVVEIEDKSVVIISNGAQESLIVGKIPIERRTESTASPAVSSVPPAPQSATPAATASPRPPAASPGTGRIPAVLPPGTHVIDTPFGPRLEQLPK